MKKNEIRKIIMRNIKINLEVAKKVQESKTFDHLLKAAFEDANILHELRLISFDKWLLLKEIICNIAFN